MKGVFHDSHWYDYTEIEEKRNVKAAAGFRQEDQKNGMSLLHASGGGGRVAA
jgi:hypothetical protein